MDKIKLSALVIKDQNNGFRYNLIEIVNFFVKIVKNYIGIKVIIIFFLNLKQLCILHFLA